MLPDRLLNPGPLTYESGALPIALCGPVMLLGSMLPSHSKIHLASNYANANRST